MTNYNKLGPGILVEMHGWVASGPGLCAGVGAELKVTDMAGQFQFCDSYL